MRLKDKVCIITGSSMGIGEAVAERFAEEGAKLIINSRSQARAEKVANALLAKGYDVMPIGADVSNKKAIDEMLEKTVKKYGRIDVLVNNAGINRIAPSFELSEADYRAVLDTNLVGVFLTAQAVGNYMKDSGGGSIINISSIFGKVCVGMRAAYSSAKHGVMGLTGVLAVEWAPYHIRVNSVAPGYIKTALDEQDQSSGGYSDDDIKHRTPMGRFGDAREVANAVLFLASDEASYITGTCADVDGGWLAYGGW